MPLLKYFVVQQFEYNIPSDPDWIIKLTTWLDQQFPMFSFFMDNQYEYPNGGFLNVAYGGSKKLTLKEADLLYQKAEFVGLISYDYKNRTEKLSSENKELLPLPESVFFVPDFKLIIKENKIFLNHNFEGLELGDILNVKIDNSLKPVDTNFDLTDKNSYIENIKAIQNNILEGDVYELNYCMGFDFKASNWNPIAAFNLLMNKSPMPFSVFAKVEDNYLLCASPERFLKLEGNKLLAQPIKGTIKRGLNLKSDEDNRKTLQYSEKERAENLMIVDLMRNDLSKVSITGSVEVAELFGVYSFPRVHQMISSVVSEIEPGTGFKQILQATFPMGSMTGAPKIKCMELIEHYENFKRGWFSGTCGYISSEGEFDFNVLIRSIIFNRKLESGYFAVGSAITYDSVPEYEYEECMLKASAILEVLKGN